MDAIVRTPEQLAQALRAQRTKKNLTQAIAGKNVGLLPKTISGLEQTPERSSVASLFRLLSALDLELVVRAKTADPEASGTEW